VTDMPFERSGLKQTARLAAKAVRDLKTPADRSLALNLPEHFTQEWIDDVVLQAHMVAPIWSDYAIVRQRPDIWGMAEYNAGNEDNHAVLAADDSLVVICGDRVGMLITTTPVANGDAIFYQLGFHCFTINVATIYYPIQFHSAAQAYGLLAYPDSDVIDELALWQTGKGLTEYILDKKRTRPVFIFRRATNFSKGDKRYLFAAKAFYGGFGPTVVSDEQFGRYRHHLSDQKCGIIGIAPGGAIFPIERDNLALSGTLCAMLEHSHITAPSIPAAESNPIGPSAMSAWGCAVSGAADVSQLREGGQRFKDHWDEVLRLFAPPVVVDHSPGTAGTEVVSSKIEARALDRPIAVLEPLVLDAEGYPVEASDIPRWLDEEFADRIVLLPRARRAVAKSRHPSPRRIAQALELLAGPKLDGHLGEADTVYEFETGLLKLRLRDGFSNAERLKGQSGADYLVEHEGRRLLLERHLCSNSSGFNDQRMVRIYYVFDRVSRKILVGWLPSHLRTSQS
jgi:hypothetical protein